MSARPRSAVRALLPGLVVILSVGAAEASRVRSLTLPEMVEVSGVIFAGEVIRVEPREIQGLPATAVTFRVEEGIRGAESGSDVTLSFLGGARLTGGLPYRIAGMPTWQVGERAVLMAYPTSELGLTAPAGLFQGRFDLRAGPAGSVHAVPHTPGQRLLEGVDPPLIRDAGLAGPITGPLPYGAFMRLLRQLARTPSAAEPR